MKTTLVAGLVLLPLAALVTVVQLDQQSRVSPTYAAAVPPAFSGSAARERSKMALEAGRPEIAVAQARQQIELRPMPAESLTILALTSLQNGDTEIARAALEAASRRGWREPISQLASAQGALEQQQYEIASQRIVALLSTENLTESALALLGELVTVPEGRQAMANRLASFGRWQDKTLVSASGVAAPDDWVATIVLAVDQGADLSCNRMGQLASRYEGMDEGAAAEKLSAIACPSA